MSTALATLAGKLAERVGMDSVDPQELITTLRQTAFKGDASDAQFIALLIVANQYGLNPWTKEIYAFPDKQNVYGSITLQSCAPTITSAHQLPGFSSSRQ